MSSPPDQAKLSKLSVVLLSLGVLVCIVILASLGNWQVGRLAWKNNLVETIEARNKMPAIAAPGPSAWNIEDLKSAEYLPVRLTGRFLHETEAHVFTSLSKPRGKQGGPGYLIYTGFQTTNGWYAIINRGFVPGRSKAVTARPEGQVEGTITVEGLLRNPPPANSFRPDDRPDNNVWFSRDAHIFAKARGLALGSTAPYTVDLVASAHPPGGLPQPGETRREFTNNHMQYAATWYGLALALAFVYGVFMWTTYRRHPGGVRAE